MSEPERFVPPFGPTFLRKQLVAEVDRYTAAGRTLASLDAAALRKRFLAAFDSWAGGAPGGSRAMNDVAAEHLLRRLPEPIELITDQVVIVINGYGPRESIAREPMVAIALGRWLWIPHIGGLLIAEGDESDALSQDFKALCAAALAGRRRPRSLIG